MTRWALVPEVPTAEMVASGDAAGDWGYNECSETLRDGGGFDNASSIYGSMLFDSPGNALLSEILAARDAIDKAETLAVWDSEVTNLRRALAKLGPAS